MKILKSLFEEQGSTDAICDKLFIPNWKNILRTRERKSIIFLSFHVPRNMHFFSLSLSITKQNFNTSLSIYLNLFSYGSFKAITCNIFHLQLHILMNFNRYSHIKMTIDVGAAIFMSKFAYIHRKISLLVHKYRVVGDANVNNFLRFFLLWTRRHATTLICSLKSFMNQL